MYSKGAFPEAFNILDTGILAFAIAMSIVLATDSLIRHFATEDRSLTAISYFQEPRICSIQRQGILREACSTF